MLTQGRVALQQYKASRSRGGDADRGDAFAAAGQDVDDDVDRMRPMAQRLGAGVPPRDLTLVETRSTPKGVLINTYRSAGPVKTGSF